MRRNISLTFNEQLRRIYRAYVNDGGALPVNTDDLYDYAVSRGLYQPQPSDIRKQFRKLMSGALREDYFTDTKGRTIRKHHVVVRNIEDDTGSKTKQGFWDDIDTATVPFMESAFRLRRKQIVGDCRQLKNDVDYFNERDVGKKIQLVFDFTNDLAEADMPTVYAAEPIK